MKRMIRPKLVAKVVDAILDSAASEYLAINSASPDAVADYAHNGMNKPLSSDEAYVAHKRIVRAMMK